LSACDILVSENGENASTSDTPTATTAPTAPLDTPSPDVPEQPPTPTPTAENAIVMAQANWNTGWFQAEIYRQLLEELGYEVMGPETMAPDNFYPTLAAGEVDLWVNGWFPLHATNVAENNGDHTITLIGSEVRGGALQGYLIDQQTATDQGITNLESLADPATAALFDADGNGKADLVGCNEGWGCEVVIEHHLDAYGLRDTVEHVQGEYDDLMRDALERYNNNEPILFYTWTPNWPLGQFTIGADVVWLEVPFSSLPDASQEELTIVPDIEGCASNPCNMGFPPNDIRVAASTTLLEQHSSVKRLLELVQIPLEDITAQNAVMFFGESTQEDIEGHAERWITEHGQQVDEWLAEARAWEDIPHLERVKARGTLRCGIQDTLPGFGTAEAGTYRGFNADMCRAVAAAIFGDPDAVEFVPLNSVERFPAVSDRRVDVLFHNTSWIASRDVGLNPPNSGIKLAFGPTIFHDGQRFMVPTESAIASLEQLDGSTICVLAGSTAEENLQDQFELRGIVFTLNRLESVNEVYDTYERGGCDAITADTSEMAARRIEFVSPEAHDILNEQISREPHSPVFIENDAQWADVVSWAVNATIYAEELGVSAENIEEMRSSEDPDIARLLGQRGQIGTKLGLDNDFALNIIQNLGNYRDIYNRNLGPETPIDLDRGPNKTWNSPEGPGGLLSSPPFR
jgi:ABC-type proline/glycine betaine transport system substrate-binding protein